MAKIKNQTNLVDLIMQPQQAGHNDFSRDFLSVFIGVITAIAAAILFPLVKFIFDNFFKLYVFTNPPKSAWKNDLVVIITLFLWLFIASVAGGYVCSLISRNREMILISINSLASITLILIVSRFQILDDPSPGYFCWLFHWAILPMQPFQVYTREKNNQRRPFKYAAISD